MVEVTVTVKIGTEIYEADILGGPMKSDRHVDQVIDKAVRRVRRYIKDGTIRRIEVRGQ